ncbi:DnaK suppressor protein [Hahella chejuensis KCTC 2396]|uniref:DnaK suppressor protein n=1 Tax=Hahella chejuensis (strain KCTC 2396) TaxID=349521 RepID=Q2SLB9_HAHCH|nr:TraR/DksA C4-type zinc finger protein [Hahella chejuensis]ABC28555.1 DnaK suppressor protein [Hahella chejuensis KCTC 2396]
MKSLESQQLSEREILAAPESDYMSAEQLAFFKDRLMALHESTCDRIQEARDQITGPMDFSDENDRASREEQSAIALRIVDREQKLLPKIQQSLKRIRLGTYGYCLESGEPIGIPRLLARPTAEYCAEVKALKEIKEHHYKS